MIENILDTGYTYKSGSFIDEFKIIVSNWQDDKSLEENFNTFENQDYFGKLTDSWNKEVLYHIKRRYFNILSKQFNYLKKALKLFGDNKVKNYLIYIYLSWVDPLFKKFIVDFVFEAYKKHKIYITTKEVISFIENLPDDPTNPRYTTHEMRRKVAGGLLSTCKDFGILEGHTEKRFLTIIIPDEILAYLLYWLKENCVSSRKIINNFTWKLFLLEKDEIEDLLLKAHDLKLIMFHQVGNLYRIDWLFNDLDEVLEYYSKKEN
ncbi:MAG: BrxA family protein [Candidatus Thorarchaeota archaeon]